MATHSVAYLTVFVFAVVIVVEDEAGGHAVWTGAIPILAFPHMLPQVLHGLAHRDRAIGVFALADVSQ